MVYQERVTEKLVKEEYDKSLNCKGKTKVQNYVDILSHQKSREDSIKGQEITRITQERFTCQLKVRGKQPHSFETNN